MVEAILDAVRPLSPVITTTFIPALLHISIYSFKLSLGGSRNPTRAKIVNSWLVSSLLIFSFFRCFL